jgi:hypothetical protein
LEILVPFFFFFGPLRLVAFLLSLSLQLMILLTGHYGHFNALTIVLSMSLLSCHDCSIAGNGGSVITFLSVMWDPVCAALGFALFGSVLVCSIVPFGQLGKKVVTLSGPLKSQAEPGSWPFSMYQKMLAPYGILHPYGLFAVMTTTRKEVIIEGSDDGKLWKEYVLPFKPSLGRTEVPWIVLPPLHLPRLDWRLWFCPLQSGQPQEWVVSLQRQLLRGDQDVLDLFAVVPFDKPPKYVRMDMYQFEVIVVDLFLFCFFFLGFFLTLIDCCSSLPTEKGAKTENIGLGENWDHTSPQPR